ncbi:MAG: WG repeat-containing protein [Clostridiaceae bacterium]
MLYKFKEGPMKGMINEKGEVVVAPVFDAISEFSEGYAIGIKFGGLTHYIDTSGAIAKVFNVESMYPFSDGMAAMRMGGCTGYINKKFQVAIEPQYSYYSRSFREGLACVAKPGENDRIYGFINKKGEQVIDYKYYSTSNFKGGLAVVTINDKIGAIDKNDKMIIAPKYDWITCFNEERAFFRSGDLWGILDNEGNEVVPAIFHPSEVEEYELTDFIEGFSILEMDSKYAYIDKNGNMRTEFQFSHASYFNEGLAVVNDGTGYKIIDKSFNTISELKCSSVGAFREGFLSVCAGEKYGFVNSRGELVAEPKYDNVGFFRNGIAAVMLNGRYGYIDKSGKEIFISDKPCNGEFFCGFFV